MFQYAIGRALAERLKTDVYFDLSAFDRYKLHHYGLDGFRGDVAAAPWHMTTGCRFWSVARRLHFSPALYFKLRGIRWVQEEGDLSHRPKRLNFEGSAYLDGYWQSSRYFKDFELRIREDFQLVEPLNQVLRRRREALGIGASITVSVHVRRGDYVTDRAANATHGTLGPDYYDRAVEHIAARLQNSFRLIIFSDDIAWAQKNLHLPASTIYVDADEHHPQVDMHLMASCNHHITANSSFSWWGAWLNASRSKTVIAPSQWFRSRDLRSDDICPEDWVRL
jgi:hypothetical protein